MRFLDENSFCGILSSQLIYQIINAEFYDFSHFIQSTGKVGRVDLAFLVTVHRAGTALSPVAVWVVRLHTVVFRTPGTQQVKSPSIYIAMEGTLTCCSGLLHAAVI